MDTRSFLALAICLVAAIAESPNGVHISFTEVPNTVRAMWSLPSTAVTSATPGYCVFGHTEQYLTLKSTVGAPYTYADGGFQGSLYDVVLGQLAPDSVYFYKCGSDAGGFSNVFRFATQPSRTTAEVKIIVWGDMGQSA
jgi:hypothetical protein